MYTVSPEEMVQRARSRARANLKTDCMELIAELIDEKCSEAIITREFTKVLSFYKEYLKRIEGRR